jgi:hypothetical protein
MMFIARTQRSSTPATLRAPDNATLSAEMDQQVAQRSTNLVRVESFLSLDVIREAFSDVQLDAGLVRRALNLLGNDELARLAAQTDRVRVEIESGQLLGHQLTYVVVALAAVIVILITVTP